MRINEIKPLFVSLIPDNIEQGILYICLPCNVAIHLCACGCKEKVVTPIDPKGWIMTYNGETVSLYPSIGNWSYKCKSHYYIKQDKIVWLSEKVCNKCKQNKKKKICLFKWF